MGRALLLFLVSFLSISSTALAATKYCPLLGPVFPAPTGLSNSPAFSAAKANITDTLDKTIQAARTSSAPSSIFDANSTSFALEIFSPSDPNPLFHYYYTSPSTANATSGVRTIDENTVFRIGSASKLWTVFLFLIAAGGEARFSDPVAKYVPELRSAVVDLSRNATKRWDEIDFVRWEDVTIGELASQLSGITRDYASDLSLITPELAATGAFPQLPESEIPPCGAVAQCNRAQFFNGLLESHPVVPTSSTPIYSNAAFQILAYALESITNQTYRSLLEKHIIEPLGLSRSSYSPPDDQYGIIPGDAASSWWSTDLGDETPAGGLYSSPKDMSTLGRAILNSTLLPPALTRRWMKPASHTSSLTYAVGAPWEIFSFQEQGRVIDLYTKEGDVGNYSAMLALSPDHNVGFTILAAGVDKVASLSDVVASAIIPALEQAGKEQADKTFGGTYSSSGDSKLNSSITITTDGGPGLKVERWISNSTDMFELIMPLVGAPQLSDVSVRLYPTGLKSPSQVSFRAVIQSLSSSSSSIGPFTRSCSTWETVDTFHYGNVGVDEFVFQLDQTTGEAVSVSPRALRVSLSETST